jgi:hypothetical protein
LDIDIVVIVKSIELISKQDWTKIRYEKIIIDGYFIWIAYNSLEGLMNKDKFEQESFANYEWSLIDLKWKENSQILYGKDIREMIPNPLNFKIDYDDILSRSLYHLDKSLGYKNSKMELEIAKREFTKAVFKFGFYLCILYDNQFHYTSIDNIMLKFNQIKIVNFNIKLLDSIFQESIHFRKTKEFVTNFKTLQTNFTLLIFSLMKKGKLHKSLTFDEFITYLEQKFNGLFNIIKFLKKAKNTSHSLKDN